MYNVYTVYNVQCTITNTVHTYEYNYSYKVPMVTLKLTNMNIM